MQLIHQVASAAFRSKAVIILLLIHSLLLFSLMCGFLCLFLVSHWLMYTSICWYLRVLQVLHRSEVVDIGVNTI